MLHVAQDAGQHSAYIIREALARVYAIRQVPDELAPEAQARLALPNRSLE